MNREDLEFARNELKRRGSAFVIVKDKEILAESKERGVAPFFFAVRELHNQLKGTSLADKIVGKAVALLSVYSQVTSVYTLLASRPAVEVLDHYNTFLEADRVVEMILNRTRDDQCPIEKIVLHADEPEEAFMLLKRRFER